MKPNKGYLGAIIISTLVAVFDIVLLAVIFSKIGNYANGTDLFFADSFSSLTIWGIIVNSALLLYLALYLCFRKR